METIKESKDGFTRSRTFTVPGGGDQKFKLLVSRYLHGENTAVQVFSEDEDEYFGTASVNVEDVDLPPGYFVFKTYSENEGLIESLLSTGLVEKTDLEVPVGRAGLQPVCRLLFAIDRTETIV
jgi:hypothetical protein